VNGAGYGHIAPKTALGRVVTIVYATFGIPLTLLTIAQVGKYMAAVFRFTYKNLVCGLGAGVCTCCRCRRHDQNPRRVTQDVTGETIADPPDYSPTHNHLQSEGQLDLGQGQGQVEVQGYEDECSQVVHGDNVNSDCEALELTVFKGTSYPS